MYRIITEVFYCLKKLPLSPVKFILSVITYILANSPQSIFCFNFDWSKKKTCLYSKFSLYLTSKLSVCNLYKIPNYTHNTAFLSTKYKMCAKKIMAQVLNAGRGASAKSYVSVKLYTLPFLRF